MVLDPATGKTLRTIQSAGTPLAFSPDKKRLFTSSVYLTADRNDRRGKAFWFDFQTGTKEKEFADLGTVDGITPSGDGTRFSTYAKSLLREFSAETGELIREISTNGKLPQGTAYAPTGELLTAVFGGSL